MGSVNTRDEMDKWRVAWIGARGANSNVMG